MRFLVRALPPSLYHLAAFLVLRCTRALWALLRRLPFDSITIGPPRRLALSLEDFVGTLGKNGGYTVVFPKERGPLVLPRTIHGEIHSRFPRSREYEVEKCGVARIAGGRVVGPYGKVIGPCDTLIHSVSAEFRGAPHENALLRSPLLPRMRRHEGALAVIGSYGADNYFHWFFDVLPRLAVAMRGPYRFDSVAVRQSSRFQVESWAMLNLPYITVPLDQQTHVAATELIVPEMPGEWGCPPGWAYRFLRERFRPTARSTASRERLFIARRGSRRIRNSEEVEYLLAERGFRSVLPETMSFSQQMLLFASCDIVVAPHGAGLANIVFCDPGTTVIEIFSPNYLNLCYWWLAGNAGIDYHYLLGKQTLAVPRDDAVYDDITVDTAELSKGVDLALAERKAPRRRSRLPTIQRGERTSSVPSGALGFLARRAGPALAAALVFEILLTPGGADAAPQPRNVVQPEKPPSSSEMDAVRRPPPLNLGALERTAPLLVENARNLVVEGKLFDNPEGPCLRISNSANVLVRRSAFFNCARVEVVQSRDVTVEENYFEGTSCAVYAARSARVRVNGNRIKNSQLNPHLIADPRAICGVIQFNEVRGPENKILDNIVLNEPGKSRTEDLINVFHSFGTRESPIDIAGNCLLGGGPSPTGNGIMTGDNGGGYIVVRNNTLIDTGGGGIGVVSGHDILLLGNRVVARGRASWSTGIWAWDLNGPCSNLTIEQNQVDWSGGRQYWSKGRCRPAALADNAFGGVDLSGLRCRVDF